jgi:hypothetical protein
MRRHVGLAIALLAGPVTWFIQSVLRPASAGHPSLLWLLGPAPNVVVGFCFPFVALSFPLDTVAATRRAIVAAGLVTFGILLGFEVWRPIAGARTYDPLDIGGHTYLVLLQLR